LGRQFCTRAAQRARRARARAPQQHSRFTAQRAQPPHRDAADIHERAGERDDGAVSVREAASSAALIRHERQLGRRKAVLAARGLAARAPARAARGAAGADPLAVLVLSGCGVGNAGGAALAGAARGLPALARLDLGGNELTAGGVAAVRAALGAGGEGGGPPAPPRAAPVALGDVADQEAEEDDEPVDAPVAGALAPEGLDADGWADDDSERGEGAEEGDTGLEAAVAAL